MAPPLAAASAAVVGWWVCAHRQNTRSLESRDEDSDSVVTLPRPTPGLQIPLREISGAVLGLQPSQEIPLFPGGNGDGRLDHFCLDAANSRLFLAALGNNCVIEIDCFAGKQSRIYGDGLVHPQGLLYAGETSHLYVACAGTGCVCVYNANTDSTHVTKPVASIDFGNEADNLRMLEDGRILVGYGEGAIGCIRQFVRDSQVDWPVDEHPESFQVESAAKKKRRIFVNVADSRHVQVLSLENGQTLARWELPAGLGANFPMHLDETHGLLFVGVRKPAASACLVVLDTDTGTEVARLPCPGDMDDICYDAKRRRLYVVSGYGFVTVINVHSREALQVIGQVRTSLGARTGCWYAERDSLYVAAPMTGTTAARLMVYHAL